MTPEGCRQWRGELGAYALGRLSDSERAALEGHLEGCDACRAELATLTPVATLLERADPARLEQAPRAPDGLAGRVLGRIRAEQRAKRKRRIRWGGFAIAGAVATAAIAVVMVSSLGGGETSQEIPGVQTVAFKTNDPQLHLGAALVPRAWGTEIHMYVKGAKRGELCRVWLRPKGGAKDPAGSFTYHYEGPDDVAILTSAIPTKNVRTVGLRVGPRQFVADVPGRGTT